MKDIFVIVTLWCVVFGDTNEVKSVMEGDSVTLHINVIDNTFDQIQWRFALEGNDRNRLIAEINEEKKIIYERIEGFIGRLDLNILTGDLTIKNTRIKHAGLYKVEIVRGGETTLMFNVTVNESPHDVSTGTDEETVLKTKGDSVSLDTGVPIQRGDLILWRFGDKGVLIAKHDKEDNKSPIYYDRGSKDRLQVNNQTGSLTISDVRSSDIGLYKLKISSNSKQTFKTFFVSVTDVYVIGLSGGSIAGIVVGVLLAVIVVAVIWSHRRESTLKNQIVTVKEKIVREGDYVNLEPWVTKLKSSDVIELSFNETVIVTAIIKDKAKRFSYEMFKDRLQVDDQTGSLTITNMRKEETGLYKIKISSSSKMKSFHQFITGGGPSHYQINVLVYEEKLVTYESSVILHPNTKIQSDDEIEWIFVDKAIIIKDNSSNMISEYDGEDERFSGKLELQNETGSLTIKNVNQDVSGFYKVKITSIKGTSYCLFKVITEGKMTTLEGQSITLRTGLDELLKDIFITEIKWMFNDEVIITGGTKEENTLSTYVGNDGRFKDRLELNNITGCLTIRDIKKSNRGMYEVKTITGEEKSVLKYHVDVLAFIDKVIAPAQGEEFVTLQTGVTEIEMDDKIVWRFGNEKICIAQFTGGTSGPLFYDLEDTRFKNKLEMDKKTGNLTIENITFNITGDYRVEIRSKNGTRPMNFIVAKPVAEVGGKVHLKTEGVQRSDYVKWIFKDEITLVTRMNGENGQVTYNTKYNERLNLDVESGSLTITGVNDTDFGVYTLRHINGRGKMSNMKFSVARGTGKDLQPSAGRRMKPETGKSSGKDLKPSAGRQMKPEIETERVYLVNEAEDRF